MVVKAFTKDTAEYQIFFKIWNYFKKYSKFDVLTDNVWQNLIKEGNEIYKEFHSPFVKELLFCCIKEIRRKLTEEEKSYEKS